MRPKDRTSSNYFIRRQAAARCFVCILLMLLLPLSVGCNAFGYGSAQQMKELQAENERLLTEFRAQKNQRERAEQALKAMESRLAESEKLIARQYNPNANRVSQLNPVVRPGPGPSPNPIWNQDPRVGAGFANEVDPNSGLRWQRRIPR